MSVIQLTTVIEAPIEIFFDLSRSVGIRLKSTEQTNETVVAGRLSGLCEVGDTITWRAKHLGLYQLLTVKIISSKFPTYFEDKMLKGAFKSFTHRHYFERHDKGTLMKDVFEFDSPFGIIGSLFNKIFLTRYMTASFPVGILLSKLLPKKKLKAVSGTRMQPVLEATHRLT